MRAHYNIGIQNTTTGDEKCLVKGGIPSNSGASAGDAAAGAVSNLSLNGTTLSGFDPRGDPTSIGQRWKRWKRAFGLYIDSKNVPEPQRKPLLLHTAGLDTQDIYFSLVGEEEDKTYREAITVLDNYFLPKCNIPFERHQFRKIEQMQSESIDQFVFRLRQRAVSCNFGANEDDVLRDQIIDKCMSNELRRKLLESDNLTLDIAIKTARAHEAVERQARVMERREGEINSIKPKSVKEGVKPGVSAKTCFACGGKGHFAKDKRCPARGKKCRLCGKTGHYSEKCFKASKKHGVCQLYNRDNSDEDTDSSGHAFAVGQTDSKTVIEVGNVPTKFIIDSGASANVVSRDTWETLKSKGINCKSRKSAKVLFAYASSEPLKCVGTFNSLVSSRETGIQIRADFVVVEGNGQSLLGRNSAEALKLLRVGPERPAVFSIIEENSAGDIRDKYPDLFKDVGLLKDYSLKLNIDGSVQPVAQSLRRVPFGLREKVEKKLQELLALDIIEEAPEGPSRWVSPLVVIPKAGGDVRICVDMREANRAIIRERQPIPTVEELLNDMNSSTVFSKLDLKMGFHQVELHKDSRYITTFVSSLGLFRYKRLMFGISSAPEKYQQIVRDVLRGCKGVANIADDIIVHGKTVEEHDKRLHYVLCTLQKRGMTLNPNKCEFRLSKLVFFGHELTSKGVNPSEEKVAAIKDAKPPRNISEVRSFMGLVQYSSKFIPDLATVAKPIQELTRKSVTYQWGKAQQEAFDELKLRLCSAETLAYFDVKRQTRIVADGSPWALGAILVQKHDDLWYVWYLTHLGV